MAYSNVGFRAWAVWGSLSLLAGVAIVSLLPLIESDSWWIRYLDFPRLQFAIAALLLLAIFFVLRGRPRRLEWIPVLGAFAALSYQAYKLHPYSKLYTPAAEAEAHCGEERALRIMIANVKRRNESAKAFLDQVAAAEPDILLVMETDAWWDERLSALRGRFQHEIQSIPDDHAFYGMHLFSTQELLSPEVRFFFGPDTPTVVTQLRLPGGQPIGFIGLHPQPPLAFSKPTTMRDAHILEAALLARESKFPMILAGDFNAVPWERVTRRAMRIGGLLDPRVGRGLFSTYDTESLLISWPLDQILFQPQLTVQSFDKLPDFGSDHRAVLATLCHQPAAEQKAPELNVDDLAKAAASIKAAQATR